MPDERVELWGFRGDDVEAARELLERMLQVEMTLFESETIGPYFFARFCEPHAELTLRPNFDPDWDGDPEDDEALAEPDFPDFGVLLYVDWNTEGHSCRERLQALGADAELLLVE